MDFHTPCDWSFPVPIHYGPGRINEIAAVCNKAAMSNPLIVTDRGSLGLPFLETLQTTLSIGGLRSGVFGDISPNPRDSEIMAGKAAFRAWDHDGIIAVGGGSGMDGGKAIALVANSDTDLWAFEFEQAAPDLSAQPGFPPLICVPTTAGTGAETASTAMVTDTERWMKWCVWHPDLVPECAILDPVLTVGLPANLTAWTGVDAMVHAIEAFCVPGLNPLCDGAALEGLRHVGHALPQAFAMPSDVGARGEMLVGSCMAGVAFSKGLGLVHAISHMIGAEFDTQHGLTNAILLPAVLRFNAPAIRGHVPRMAQALDLKDTSFDGLYTHVCGLLDRLGIPQTLAGIGVPEDCVARIAEKALHDSAAGTNPRAASAAEVEEILREALGSGRPARS